jgi:hypothetical protein
MNKVFRQSKHLLREHAGTRADNVCISDVLAATSTSRRFALPAQSASYNILSQVVALPAPGDAEDQNKRRALSARRLLRRRLLAAHQAPAYPPTSAVRRVPSQQRRHISHHADVDIL